MSQTGASGEAHDQRRWWVLASCCLLVFGRLIAPPLWAIMPPTLLQAFGAQGDIFRLYSSLGALPQIVFLMLGGVLGDLLGRRRVLLSGACAYLVLCTLCLFAPGHTWLLIFRTLGNWCSCLIAPLALATVRLTFSKRELPLAILFYTGALSVAGLLAPLIGVVLDGPIGWRAMFLLPLIATGAGALLALRYIGESKLADEHRQLDAVGSAAWATVLLVLFYTTLGSNSPSGWAWPVTLGALAVGLLGGGLLIWYERKAAGKTLRRAPRRALAVVLFAGALMNMVLVGYFLQLYGFFATAHNFGAVLAVIALAPALPAILLIIGLITWFQRRFEARALISAGLLVMALAVALTALGATWASYWWFILPMMLLMMGYMVVATAWTTLFFLVVQSDSAGVNAAINNCAGLIGSVLGASLLGTLLVAFGRSAYLRRLEAMGLPQTLSASKLALLDLVLRLDAVEMPEQQRALLDTLLVGYREAYATAFAQVLGLLAAACLVCALFVWFSLGRNDYAVTIWSRSAASEPEALG